MGEPRAPSSSKSSSTRTRGRKTASPASTSARHARRPTSCTRSCGSYEPDVLGLPRPNTHPERVPAIGPGDPRAESLLVPGPLLPRRGLRRKVPLHGQVAAVQAASMSFVYTHGGVLILDHGFADQRRSFYRLPRPGARPRRRDGMYAEGRRSPTGGASEEAKRGIGRLALPPARRSCRWRSSAPATYAAGRRRFPKIRVYYGEPFAYERVERRRATKSRPSPSAIFAEVRALYARRRPRRARPLPEPRRRGACRAPAAPAAHPPPAPPRRPGRARHAVGERLRRWRRSRAGEHRGEHGRRRGRRRPRGSRSWRLTPGPPLRPHRRQHGVGRGREHERHARAGRG